MRDRRRILMTVLMGGGDAAWSPLNLPGLQAWYDATAPLYTDVDKTALATANDALVYVWPDLSGNGRDLIRKTSDTYRPKLRNNVYNGRRTVRFTPSASCMITTATWQAFPSKRGSVYISVFGSSSSLLGLVIGSSTQLVVYQNVANTNKFYDTTNRAAAAADSKLGVAVESYIRTSNTNMDLYRDGVLDSHITIGDNQPDSAAFQVANAASNGCRADINEIIILDHVSSDAERITIENYLKSKWNRPTRTPVWTRAGNALVATEAFEDSSLYEVTVLYEGSPQILVGPANVFKAWYTSGWTNPYAINYAESEDGKTWTKYASNPIIAEHGRSCIVKNGAVYWLYTKNAGTIDLYTSNDGITFALDTETVLTKSAADWDSERIDNLHVWQEGVNDWRMLYDGKSAAVSYYSMGYATSTDGKTWTKYASNPVINDGYASGPCMRKVGSTFWLWAHGSKEESTLPTECYRYYSTDCINWTRSPLYSPVLSRISADEGVGYLGAGQIADPWIMEVGGACYLFYTASSNGGVSTGNMHIKLATAAMTLAELVTTQEGD